MDEELLDRSDVPLFAARSRLLLLHKFEGAGAAFNARPLPLVPVPCVSWNCALMS